MLYRLILITLLTIVVYAGNGQTRLAILGSGNPNPDPEHHGPAVAVLVNDQAYLVDFGTGVVRQAAALSPRYGGTEQALTAKNLNRAFLTHLHSDHTIGLPDLLLTPWVMTREEPLHIIGPIGTKKMAEAIIEAYDADIQYRLNGLEPANNTGWRVKVDEIDKEGIVYTDSLVQVEAFDVTHGTWEQSFGFRFTTEDCVIVISGDTNPSENLIKWAKGADILLHEVYYQAGWEKKDEFWKTYHKANHTSTHELAEIANTVQPKQLVCYHTLYWGGTDKDILDEIAENYSGLVKIAHDGDIIHPTR